MNTKFEQLLANLIQEIQSNTQFDIPNLDPPKRNRKFSTVDKIRHDRKTTWPWAEKDEDDKIPQVTLRTRDYDILSEVESSTQLLNESNILDFTKLELISLIEENLKNTSILCNPSHEFYVLCEEIGKRDPEFILKLSLYVRNILNIRNCANALLAWAISDVNCSQFVDAYFDVIIVLPTDLLQVLTNLWVRTPINYIPRRARKCFERRLLAFSDFHLRKYHGRREIIKINYDEKSYITLKRLVKLLHISESCEKVMKILNCKYPKTAAEFYNSKLEGEFDANYAGKRMNFDMVLTWQTQISIQGNKAEQWNELLEQRALPYNALLKNLRNLAIANLDDDHIRMAVEKLTFENEVKHSRTFPTDYLAALNALNELNAPDKEKPKFGRVGRRRFYKRIINKAKSYNIEPYVEAVKKAFEIATRLNVKSIPGKTVIFTDCSEMAENESQRDLFFGVMIKSRCEYCEYYIHYNDFICKIDLDKCNLETIVEIKMHWAKFISEVDKMRMNLFSLAKENEKKEEEEKENLNIFRQREVSETPKHCMYMDGWMDLYQEGGPSHQMIKMAHINYFIFEIFSSNHNVRKIDNAISIGVIPHTRIINFLSAYRHFKNNSMKRIVISKCYQTEKPHANDIFLNYGTQEALNFLTSTGSIGELAEIEQIHKKFNIKTATGEHDEKTISDNQLPYTMSSRGLRIFIASTFNDMESERDVFSKIIIPALRDCARRLLINLYDIDMRWGVENLYGNSTIEVCLEEASRSDIFIGIIGQRYGQQVESYDLMLKNPNLQWLMSYPKMASVTELEIVAGVFNRLEHMRHRSFFYFRDCDNISEQLVDVEDKAKRLNLLKNKIKDCNLQIFNYSAKYDEAKNEITNLDWFGQSVYDNIWQCTLDYKNAFLDKSRYIENINDQIKIRFNQINKAFRGSKLNDICMDIVQYLINTENQMVILKGKSGAGKTFLISKISQLWTNHSSHFKNVIVYTDILKTLSDDIRNLNTIFIDYIIFEIFKTITKTDEIDWNNMSLPAKLRKLSALVKGSSMKFLVCVDEMIDNKLNIQLIRQLLAPYIRIVITSDHNVELDSCEIIEMENLDMRTRREMVTAKLNDTCVENSKIRTLIMKTDASFPLYIQMACYKLSNADNCIEKAIAEIPKHFIPLVEDIFRTIKDKYFERLCIDTVMGFLSNCEYINEEVLLNYMYIHETLPEKYKLQPMSKIVSAYTTNVPRKFRSAFFAALFDLKKGLGLVDTQGGFIWLNHSVIRNYFNQSHCITEKMLFVKATFTWIQCCPKGKWSNNRHIVKLPQALLDIELFDELFDLFHNDDFMYCRCNKGHIQQLLNEMKALQIHKCEIEKKYLHILNISRLLTMYPDEFQAIFDTNAIWLNKINSESFQIHKYKCAITTMSVNGSLVVVGCNDGLIEVFDYVQNKQITYFIDSPTTVKSICFCNMKTIACGYMDGLLIIWDIEECLKVKSYQQFEDAITDISLAANDELIAVSDMLGIICVYNNKSFSYVNKWSILDSSPISCLVDLTDQRLLIAFTWSRLAYFFEPYDGECRLKVNFEWCLNAQMLNAEKILYCLTGQMEIATYLHNKKSHTLYNMGSNITTFDSRPSQIACGNINGSISLFNTNRANSEVVQLTELTKCEHIVATPHFLATAMSDGKLCIYTFYNSKYHLKYKDVSKKNVNIVKLVAHNDLIVIRYKNSNTNYLVNTTSGYLDPCNAIQSSYVDSKDMMIRSLTNDTVLMIYIYESMIRVSNHTLVKHFTKINITPIHSVNDYVVASEITAFDAGEPENDSVTLALATRNKDLHLLKTEQSQITEIDCMKNVKETIHDISIVQTEKVTLITISRNVDNPNMVLWKLNQNNKLGMMSIVTLSDDIPCNIFGFILTLKSGKLRKYADDSITYPIWECQANLGKKIAYAKSIYSDKIGRVTNEQIFTYENKICRRYLIPPLEKDLFELNVHNDSVSNVKIVELDDSPAVLSAGNDGSLVLSKGSKFHSNVLVSVDITVGSNSMVYCTLLFTKGKIIVWKRVLNTNNWLILKTLDVDIDDAIYASYCDSDVIDIMTQNGTLYEMRVDIMTLEVAKEYPALIACNLGPKIDLKNKLFIHFTGTQNFTKSENMHYCSIQDFNRKLKIDVKQYYSRVFILENTALLVNANLQYFDLKNIKEPSENNCSSQSADGTQVSSRSFVVSEIDIYFVTKDNARIYNKDYDVFSEKCIEVSGTSFKSGFDIIVGTTKGYIMKLHVSDEQVIVKKQLSKDRHSSLIRTISISDKFVYSSSDDHTIYKWSLENLNLIKKYFTTSICDDIFVCPDEVVIVSCKNGNVYQL